MAWTVVDLAGEEMVSFEHVSEALSLARPGGLRWCRGRCPRRRTPWRWRSVPSIGPSTLRDLLADDPPSVAWARTAAQRESGPKWTDLGAPRRTQHQRAHGGVGGYAVAAGRRPRGAGDCLLPGRPRRPRGAPTVALVGTRAPTRYGIGVAAQLGAELSAAGVSVVSGLALGIDGAAHEGACGAGAPPIGVVAGGLDDPYPRRHARLWDTGGGARGRSSRSDLPGCARRSGASPCGTGCWRRSATSWWSSRAGTTAGRGTPSRPRSERGVAVGAVPGSIRSATSEGTNALLADGAFPVCSAADVLVALSLAGASVPAPATVVTRSRPRRPEPGEDRRVYDALSPDPTSLDELARMTGLDLPSLCGALERLARAGLAVDVGGWWERG